MVGAKWNRGLPTVSGNFFLANADGSDIEFVSAVKLPNGSVRVFAGSDEITEANLSYGPVPGIERSLSSARRKDAPADPIEA